MATKTYAPIQTQVLKASPVIWQEPAPGATGPWGFMPGMLAPATDASGRAVVTKPADVTQQAEYYRRLAEAGVPGLMPYTPEGIRAGASVFTQASNGGPMTADAAGAVPGSVVPPKQWPPACLTQPGFIECQKTCTSGMFIAPECQPNSTPEKCQTYLENCIEKNCARACTGPLELDKPAPKAKEDPWKNVLKYSLIAGGAVLALALIRKM